MMEIEREEQRAEAVAKLAQMADDPELMEAVLAKLNHRQQFQGARESSKATFLGKPTLRKY
jgi:hypothetical protein